MRHALASLLLLAAPLPALADVPTLGEGLTLCLDRMSDPVGLAEAAIVGGWVPQESAGDVATYAKGRVTLYLPLDATGCTVVADGVQTAEVEAPLAEAMTATGSLGVRAFQTEIGCVAVELADGRVVTWNGDGPDPACDSVTGSAVTIYIPGG
jgi:hypothetical protein